MARPAGDTLSEPRNHNRDEPLVEIRDLSVDYRTGKKSTVAVVKDINLDLYPGESVALELQEAGERVTLTGDLRRFEAVGQIHAPIMPTGCDKTQSSMPPEASIR